MVRVSLGGSLVMVVWEVVVVERSGRVRRVLGLWVSWSGGDVASLVWGGCHVFEASQSVLLAGPEAGGSGAVVVL